MSFKYVKYRLPFTSPLQTSKQTFEYREGFILEYTVDDFQYYGEAAPLPGYSKETPEEVRKTLGELKDEIANSLDTSNPLEKLQDFYKEEELQASLQFALDSIASQIEAKQNNSSLLDYLFPDAPSKVPVNALGSLQSDNFLKNTQQLIAEGFKTVKFKVGFNFDTEFKRLEKIRSEFPDLKIRLDANQSWSTEEALRYFQKLEPLNIEYCEEPLKEAIPENFELLHKHTQVPLALDESVSHLSYWPNLLPYTSYIILKPMLLGNFTKNIETKRLSDTHNNKVVFTTSLESGVGRRITAILASGLGSSQTAHGLNTGKLLAEDIASDIAYISNGAYHINRHHQPRIDFEKLGDVTSSS